MRFLPERWKMAAACLSLAGVCAIAAARADERDYDYVPRDASASRMIDGPKCLSLGALAGYAPCDPGSHQEFLDAIHHWRMERRIYVGYDGGRYAAPAQQWVQSAFLQPLMMVEDRYLFDPATAKYTVDRYLDDLAKRYGGIDQVIVWPTYPNLGIDNRNQLDMIAAMPGGFAGVKAMVADFH